MEFHRHAILLYHALTNQPTLPIKVCDELVINRVCGVLHPAYRFLYSRLRAGPRTVISTLSHAAAPFFDRFLATFFTIIFTLPFHECC